MIVIPPNEVNDLTLKATAIPEPFQPPAYNAGTTYAFGAKVYDTSTKIAYQSLQDGNTGNTPATSALWWEAIGYYEATWLVGTTYAANDIVLYQHRLYKSQSAGNVGNNPLLDAVHWEDLQASNARAMFDYKQNTKSVYNFDKTGGVSATGDFIAGAYTKDGASASIGTDLVLTRSGNAQYFDVSGVLQTAGSNTLRIDYDPVTHTKLGVLIEEQRINVVQNNTMVGAAAATPGTLPTRWTLGTIPSGITRQIVAATTENGMAYIDLKFSGTPGSTLDADLLFDATTGNAAALNENWISSVYHKLSAGAMTNFTAALLLQGRTSGGVLTADAYTQAFTPGATLARTVLAQKMTDTTTVNAVSGIRFHFTSGQAMNAQIRIYLPQLEKGTTLLVSSVIKTANAGAVTRNADSLQINAVGYNDWLFTQSDNTLPEIPAVNGNLTLTSAKLKYGVNWLKNYTATEVVSVYVQYPKRVDTVAVLGVIADSVRVRSYSNGVLMYDKTIDLFTRVAIDWYDYFFKDFDQTDALLFEDIPPISGSDIYISFYRATGNVVVSAVCVGVAHDIGAIQYGAERDVQNFSTVSRDTFGNAILVQRQNVPKINGQCWVPAASVPALEIIRDGLNAIPAVWAGLDDLDANYFRALLMLGVYNQFSINITYPEVAVLTLEVQSTI